MSREKNDRIDEAVEVGPNPMRLGLHSYRAVMRDPVHGLVPLNELEYRIVQSNVLRRLHGISQLGLMRLVYPGASHTRFEHSIGVMHLMGVAANMVVIQAGREKTLCEALFQECTEENKGFFVQVARLVGLLHDVGHLPFSHHFELGLDYAINRLGARIDLSWHQGSIKKIHETITMHLIERLAGKMSDFNSYLPYVKAVLYGTDDFEGPISHGAVNVLRNLISGTVDLDRLDYILRDSHHAGVVYGRVHVDRLISMIRLLPRDKTIRLVYDVKGISALEDLYDARLKLYRWLYLHHKSAAFYIALGHIIAEMSRWDGWGHVPDAASLEELLKPETLTSNIVSGQYYFDEHDFESMARLMASTGRGARWVKAIYEHRELLPVSMIKRPEDLVVSVIVERPERTLTKMYKRYEDPEERFAFEERIKEAHKRMIRRKVVQDCGTEPEIEVVAVYLQVESGKGEGGVEVVASSGDVLSVEKASRYLARLYEYAREPIIYVYEYSDNECIHRVIRESRGRLSKKILEELPRKPIKRMV